jgi:YD repeat-containing protein
MESHRNFFGALILGTLLIAQQAWGQSPNGNDNPTGVAGDYGGSVTTGGGYDPYTGNAKRVIDDIVVPGAAGAYPLKWTRFLNTRGGWTNSYQYSLYIRSMSNDWHYYDNPYEGPDGHVAYPDGRQVDLWYQDSTHWDAPEADGPQGIGHRVEATGGGNYKLIMSDGGQVLFATQSYWNGGGWVQGIFSIAIVDPYGQTTTFGRDTQGRLTTVTEPAGRYLQVYYGDHGVSTVQAWDGRGNLMESVSYGYTTSQVYWQFVNSYVSVTNLTQAYYDDGAVATYTYRDSNVADNTFNTILTKLVETCDDPRYAGPMKRIKYEYMPHYSSNTAAWGQIKAERNATTDQVVSQITYPPYGDPNPANRTETRGDGPSRLIVCGPIGCTRWTDYQNHTSSITYLAGFNGWLYTDARGNTTTNERYPGPGAIWKITRPGDGTTVEFTYSDPNNPFYMTGRKDENGYWTYFDRDGNNRVWRIRYPDSGTEEFTYNGFGQVLTHKLRTGGTETFTYDTRGLKQTSYPPATGSDPAPWNHPTRYFYYDNGPNTDRLLRVQDPRGNSTTYEYNQRGQVTRVTHQDSTYTQSAYNLDGTLAWTADENHPNASWNEKERTRYTYDEYRRVLTVTNPMNETTTNYYGLDWANPLVHTTNSPKWTKSPMQKNVVYGYDENFRKSYQVQALQTADEAWSWFDYDEVGNLAWTRDPRGKVTTFGYDARNRKIWMNDPIPSDRNSTGHTMNWEYDYVGHKKKETRADDTFRRWDYDSMNQASDTYGFANEHTHYDHDAAGNVTWITDAKGAQYAYYYDQLNRKVSQWYPLDATGVSRYDAWYRDIAGNIIRHDSPEGNVQIFEYDNRNRMTHSYWWSNVGPSVVTGYDAASRVTGITTNNGETAIGYGYDDANRQIWEDQTLAGYSTRRVETPRDADGTGLR